MTAVAPQVEADAAALAAVTAHIPDTTDVHGIADTAALVLTDDARLADARTPTAHVATHATGGTDPLTPGAIGAELAGAAVAAQAAAADHADEVGALWRPEDVGLAAWNMPTAGPVYAAVIPVLGRLELARIPIRRAVTVSSVCLVVVTAGVTLANCFAVLYDDGGNLIGQSSDRSAVWNTLGVKYDALTTPVALAAGTFVRAGWLVGSAGTLPRFAGVGGSSNLYLIGDNAPALGPAQQYLLASFGAGLTAPPAAATPLGSGIGQVLPWVGLR